MNARRARAGIAASSIRNLRICLQPRGITRNSTRFRKLSKPVADEFGPALRVRLANADQLADVRVGEAARSEDDHQCGLERLGLGLLLGIDLVSEEFGFVDELANEGVHFVGPVGAGVGAEAVEGPGLLRAVHPTPSSAWRLPHSRSGDW